MSIYKIKLYYFNLNGRTVIESFWPWRLSPKTWLYLSPLLSMMSSALNYRHQKQLPTYLRLTHWFFPLDLPTKKKTGKPSPKCPPLSTKLISRFPLRKVRLYLSWIFCFFLKFPAPHFLCLVQVFIYFFTTTLILI